MPHSSSLPRQEQTYDSVSQNVAGTTDKPAENQNKHVLGPAFCSLPVPQQRKLICSKRPQKSGDLSISPVSRKKGKRRGERSSTYFPFSSYYEQKRDRHQHEIQNPPHASTPESCYILVLLFFFSRFSPPLLLHRQLGANHRTKTRTKTEKNNHLQQRKPLATPYLAPDHQRARQTTPAPRPTNPLRLTDLSGSSVSTAKRQISTAG